MKMMLANAGADAVTNEVSGLSAVLVDVVIAAAFCAFVILGAKVVTKAFKGMLGDECWDSNGKPEHWARDARRAMRENMSDRTNSTHIAYRPDGRPISAGATGQLAGTFGKGGPLSKSTYKG